MQLQRLLANRQYFFAGWTCDRAVDVGELAAVAFFPRPDCGGVYVRSLMAIPFYLRVADNLWLMKQGARGRGVRLCGTLRELMHPRGSATKGPRTG